MLSKDFTTNGVVWSQGWGIGLEQWDCCAEFEFVEFVLVCSYVRRPQKIFENESEKIAFLSGVNVVLTEH